MEIFDYDSFLSQDEIEKIESQVFDLKAYWKNMLEYPSCTDKKNFFHPHLLRQVVLQIKYEILSNTTVITRETCEYIWSFLCKNYSYIELEKTLDFSNFKKILEIIQESENIDERIINVIYSKLYEKDECQNMLGDAIYLFNKSGRRNIDWNTQKIVKENFKWLHEKTADTISEIFKFPVELDQSLPCPGFHIFGLNTYDSCEYHYHQDITILDYYPNVDPKKIYSFLSLIKSTTQEPPHLEYISIFDTFQKMYRYGSLHFWPGLLKHRIGSFSLQEDQYRITYQGHMYFDEEKKTYKLYF